MALIIPTASAAVDSVRISVGIAQNVGRNAMNVHVTVSHTTVVVVEPGKQMRPTNPTPVMKIGIATPIGVPSVEEHGDERHSVGNGAEKSNSHVGQSRFAFQHGGEKEDDRVGGKVVEKGRQGEQHDAA